MTINRSSRFLTKSFNLPFLARTLQMVLLCRARVSKSKPFLVPFHTMAKPEIAKNRRLMQRGKEWMKLYALHVFYRAPLTDTNAMSPRRRREAQPRIQIPWMLVAQWHLLNAEDERNESRDDESESLNNYHFTKLQFMSPADEFSFSFHRQVYIALFNPLRVSRRRFKTILNCMKTVRKLKSQEIYVQEKITKVDSLSLVLSGKWVDDWAHSMCDLFMAYFYRTDSSCRKTKKPFTLSSLISSSTHQNTSESAPTITSKSPSQR